MNEWISMKDEEPSQEGEIIFISEKTDERIGIALPERKMVLLKRTDLSFDEIEYWMPLPQMPRK